MALYTFYVKKKDENKFVSANIHHELAFLDFFAMQFDNKKELMKFLGVDFSKYDDIGIMYRTTLKNGKKTVVLLPIYFDAFELNQIAGSMVDVSKLKGRTIYENLAIAYNNPKMVKTKKSVPMIKPVEEILESVIELAENKEQLYEGSNSYGDLEQVANTFGVTSVRISQIKANALKTYENEIKRSLGNDLTRSYLVIRRAYETLRSKGILKGNLMRSKRNLPSLTMGRIYESYIAKNDRDYYTNKYSSSSNLHLTEYEEYLLQQISYGDEEACARAAEELMKSSTERLEALNPFISQARALRGNSKKIGSID